jgi:hypothetical protein
MKHFRLGCMYRMSRAVALEHQQVTNQYTDLVHLILMLEQQLEQFR